nr:MAG TPA: hypothetical protein [Caudoviricetes sp.]
MSSLESRAFFMLVCERSINFGRVPPCGALMRPLPCWWKSTGQARPFLFVPTMTKPACYLTTQPQLRAARTTLYPSGTIRS